MPGTRDVVSDPPTDTQHPALYEGAVYILGAIAILCVIAIAVLVWRGYQVPDGLSAMGLTCVGGLVGLLTRRQA